MTDHDGGASRASMLTALALLWLVGVALRLTMPTAARARAH
jgi:hypothetical protein